jgi:hypothetical protein
MEWQSIDTAPKDSTLFIGYEDGCGVKITYWDDYYGVRDGGFRIFASHGWRPTHWMPLPPPPKP